MRAVAQLDKQIDLTGSQHVQPPSMHDKWMDRRKAAPLNLLHRNTPELQTYHPGASRCLPGMVPGCEVKSCDMEQEGLPNMT